MKFTIYIGVESDGEYSETVYRVWKDTRFTGTFYSMRDALLYISAVIGDDETATIEVARKPAT